MIHRNFNNLILDAVKQGDQIGGPYALAKILSKSLEFNNGFEENDLRNRYLNWWRGDAFDTGPTYASVFNKVNRGMEPKLVVKKVHEDFGFNTAGCGPAHRATPLAGFINITTDKLVSLARQEAKITHYDDDAGNGSAIVILLCRYLIEGESWEKAKSLVSLHPDLHKSWEKVKNAKLSPDGYIFNVIHSTIYFIDQNKSLSDSIQFSGKANYSAILFSVITNLLKSNQKLSSNNISK